MIENINPIIFPASKGLHLLDIGSAEGHNSIALKAKGATITAIEIDPNLVEDFNNNAAAKGITIIEGDATNMPFKANSFDGAILLEVIEHIKPTEQLLQEVNRVLKPGGVLCIGVPTGYTERVYWRLHPGYASNATHVKIFSKRQLKELIEAAGYRVLKIETKNFVPAISWFFHALLRSKSDHTGKILNHSGVDRVLNSFFKTWAKTPVLNRGLGLMSQHFGKSWYFYCEKIA